MVSTGAVTVASRSQLVRSLKDVLGKLAIELIESDQLNAAGLLVGAAQLVDQAGEALEEAGEALEVTAAASAFFDVSD